MHVGESQRLIRNQSFPYRVDFPQRRIHRYILSDPGFIRQVQAAAMRKLLAPDNQIPCIAADGSHAERLNIHVSWIRVLGKARNPCPHFSVESGYTAKRSLIFSDIIEIEYAKYIKAHRKRDACIPMQPAWARVIDAVFERRIETCPVYAGNKLLSSPHLGKCFFDARRLAVPVQNRMLK